MNSRQVSNVIDHEIHLYGRSLQNSSVPPLCTLPHGIPSSVRPSHVAVVLACLPDLSLTIDKAGRPHVDQNGVHIQSSGRDVDALRRRVHPDIFKSGHSLEDGWSSRFQTR